MWPDGSPLTVAGAAGVSNPVPFSSPSPGNLSQPGRYRSAASAVNRLSAPCRNDRAHTVSILHISFYSIDF